MSSNDYIVSQLHASLDWQVQNLERLAPGIEAAAEIMGRSLLQERKILAAGDGKASHIAQYFCNVMLHQLNIERPGLPAISLSQDAATLSAIASESSNQVYSKQITALGQAGDSLLILTAQGGPHQLKAIQAAHERGINVVCISGPECDLKPLLSHEDVELEILGDCGARLSETQMLVVNCLAGLIEQQLFGDF